MKSDKKYRTIFELSPEAIAVIDKEGYLLDANKKMYDWLGFKPKDLMGKNISQLPFLRRSDRPKIKERFTQRVSGDEVSSYEVEVITKRREKRIGEVIASVLKDEAGEILGEIAMIVDITERKKFVEALKMSEEKYRLITENTSDFIVIVKFNGKYVYVSPSHGQLGYEPGDLLGRSGFNMISKEDRKNLIPLVKKYAKAVLTKGIDKVVKEMVEHIEFRFRDKWNEWHYMEATANLIKSFSGKGYDILIVYRDVTSRKIMELELKKSRMLLDGANKELTQKVEALEDAIGHIKRLEGLVPICSNCKKIRTEGKDAKDPEAWVALEDYITEKTEASLTHGLCPDCAKKLYGRMYRAER